MIEPASYWEGRWSITVRQEDLVWWLTPCLKLSEAKLLLEQFQEEGVCFDLDLIKEVPIENSRIRELTDQFLSRGEAVA